MKKLLLIPAILLITLKIMFAQDCKWEVKKQDPISDTKYVKSKKNSNFIKGEKPSPGVLPYFKSHIELKEGKVSIFIHYGISPMLSLEKIQNPKMIIKLADGTKIELVSEEQFLTLVDVRVNITSADLRWTLTNEDLKKLAASKIIATRISFAGQDYSFTVDDKPAQELLKMFSCMTAEI